MFPSKLDTKPAWKFGRMVSENEPSLFGAADICQCRRSHVVQCNDDVLHDFEYPAYVITFAGVPIQSFGSTDSCLDAARQILKLKAEATYARTADRSAKNVEKARSQPEMWTEVTETDRLTADRRLQMIFNVLTFPLGAVLVDGAQIVERYCAI